MDRSMRRSAALAIGAGLLGGVVLAISRAMLRRPHVRLEINKETSLSPEAVIGQVTAVQKEPDLIPFVKAVEVLEQDLNSVRYIVRGSTFGVPWCMRYNKSWDYESGTVRWFSEQGSYGLRNVGRLRVDVQPSGNVIRLATGYSVDYPGVGRTMEALIRPILSYAFGRWLDRISRP